MVKLYWEPMNPGRIVCINHGSMRIEAYDALTRADIKSLGNVQCEDFTLGNCGGSI